MSIFASLSAPSDEDHADDCGIWDTTDLGIWKMRDASTCTCSGQPDAPLVYQGSHVLPSDHDPRGGWVDIALIPSHITRDGRDDKPEDEKPWPYLRFGINGEAVILTRHNVEQIAETLNDWLARTAA